MIAADFTSRPIPYGGRTAPSGSYPSRKPLMGFSLPGSQAFMILD